MAKKRSTKAKPAAKRRNVAQQRAQAAWDRMEELGGHGIWDGEMVVMNFDGLPITDDDLELFKDFPFIQTLELSDTAITDAGLEHLKDLPVLEDLVVINTNISMKALQAFAKTHPALKITTKRIPPPKGTVNPFTGKPF